MGTFNTIFFSITKLVASSFKTLFFSSMNSAHSKINGTLPLNKVIPRLQKENNPSKEEHKTPPLVNRTVKIIAKENNFAREEPRNVHKLVKEINNHSKEDLNPVVHKPVAEENLACEPDVSLATDLAGVASQEPLVKQPQMLSIRLDVTSNKKVVNSNNKSMLNVENRDRNEDLLENKRLSSHPVVEKGGGKVATAQHHSRLENDDYRSPLEAFGIST